MQFQELHGAELTFSPALLILLVKTQAVTVAGRLLPGP